VGPRAVLDVVVKRKIPSPSRDSNPPSVAYIKIILYHLFEDTQEKL